MQLISDSVLTDFRSKISLEYFDFVGGKDDFRAECGVTYTGNGNKFSSVAHQRASKVITNIAALGLTFSYKLILVYMCH